MAEKHDTRAAGLTFKRKNQFKMINVVSKICAYTLQRHDSINAEVLVRWKRQDTMIPMLQFLSFKVR